jgi:hypothetical protein
LFADNSSPDLWSYCAPMNGEILIAIHGKAHS